MNKDIRNSNYNRLLRLKEVLQIIPISKSSWWSGVKSGRFPAGIKLGSRTTCWRESDIMQIVDRGV